MDRYGYNLSRLSTLPCPHLHPPVHPLPHQSILSLKHDIDVQVADRVDVVIADVDGVAVVGKVEMGIHYRTRILLHLVLDSDGGVGNNRAVVFVLDVDVVRPGLVLDPGVEQAHYAADAATRRLLDLVDGLWRVVSSLTEPKSDVRRMVLDK